MWRGIEGRQEVWIGRYRRLDFFPDQVFVVAADDHRVDFAVVVSADETPAFGSGMKEEVG